MGAAFGGLANAALRVRVNPSRSNVFRGCVRISCASALIGALAGCGNREAVPPKPANTSASTGAQGAARTPQTPPTVSATNATTTPNDGPAVSLANEKAIRELFAGLKGKPAVVNIWATWCPPCVAEMPDLVVFYNNNAKSGVQFLSLSGDFSYSIDDTLKPFIRDKNIPFPVHVLDSTDPTVLASILGVQSTKWNGGLPVTFVYDKEGALVKSWLQPVSTADLEAAVKPLL